MNTETMSQRVAPGAALGGFLGPFWHKLCGGVVAGNEVPRSASRVSAHPVLMAAAALRLARCIFGNIGEQQVLLIGIADVIEPYADSFGAQQPRRLTVVSHTEARARRLAQRINGQAVGLHELPAQLPLHDIVVSGTNSPLPILGKGMIERAIKCRKHRPLLIIDVAARQDVEPEAGELNDVYLYRGEDLDQIVRDYRDAIRTLCPQALLSRGALLGGQGVCS